MRHAGQDCLDQLEPLLAQLRLLPSLTEKSRGVFYVRSRAFLHFHEDPRGIFGDVRCEDGGDFDRIDVTVESGRSMLLALVTARLTA